MSSYNVDFVGDANLRSKDLTITRNATIGALNVSSANQGVFTLTNDSGYARVLGLDENLYFQTGSSATTDARGDFLFTSVYAGTEFLRIKGATGNVGIGTSTPDATLHVRNSGTAANSDNLVVDVTGPWMRIGDGSDERTFTGGSGIKFHDAGVAHYSIGQKNGVLQIGQTGSNGDVLFPGGGTDREAALCVTTDGNVGLGKTDPAYTLDVSGTSNVSAYYQQGQLLYPQRRWEVDLSSQSTDNFYPVIFYHNVADGLAGQYGDLPPVNFKVFGQSLIGSDSYNECTLIGYFRGGGWSDHQYMYDVHERRYTAGERRFLGVYQGTQSFVEGFAIYMRGGYYYSILTDAVDVTVHTSAVTKGNSVFAIKDDTGADVSGTSASIVQGVDIYSPSSLSTRWTSGDLRIQSGSNLVVDETTFYVDGVNNSVGIGTTLPTQSLDVNGTARFVTSVITPTIYGESSALSLGQSYSYATNIYGGGAVTMNSDGSEVARFSGGSGGHVGINTASSLSGSKLTIFKGDNDEITNKVHLSLSSSNVDAHAAGFLGPGIEFRQRWWSGGGVPEVTGAIHGIKTAANGASGGGLAFRTFEENVGMGTKMVLHDTGKLGIGTTDPAYTLDLSGPSRHKGLLIYTGFGNNVARPSISSGDTHPSYEIRACGVGAGGGTGFSTGADDGFLRLRAGGGTDTGNSTFIDLSGYSTYSGGDMLRTIVFGTSGTERMRITSDGNTVCRGTGTFSLNDESEFVTSTDNKNWMSHTWDTPGSYPDKDVFRYFRGSSQMIRSAESDTTLIRGIDPYGKTSIVFRANGVNSGGPNGGWAIQFAVNANKTYVSIVFVKRTSSAVGGTFYHGCDQSQTKDLSGTDNTNPYFHYVGINALPQDVWCVSIGFVHFYGAGTSDDTGLAGIYRLDTMERLATGTEYAHRYDGSATRYQIHRAFMFYNGTSGTTLEFWNPGFYEHSSSNHAMSILSFFAKKLAASSVGIGVSPSYPLHVGETVSRIYRWNAQTTVYDYTFPTRGFYIVGFNYGFFYDNNTSAVFIIQVGSGYNNPLISRLVGGSVYPQATAQSGTVVRFSASSAPAAYNDWLLNIWFCGQGIYN